MNDFRKNDRFGGDRGGNKFGKKSFGRPSFGGDRGGDRFNKPTQMHQTICAECKKSCEVPFKPNGDKPVYCRDCFGNTPKGQDMMGGRGDRKDFAPRNDYAPRGDFQKKRFEKPSYSAPVQAPAARVDDKRFDELKREVAAMNIKLDRVISMIETKSAVNVATEAPTSETTKAPKKAKKVAKK